MSQGCRERMWYRRPGVFVAAGVTVTFIVSTQILAARDKQHDGVRNTVHGGCVKTVPLGQATITDNPTPGALEEQLQSEATRSFDEGGSSGSSLKFTEPMQALSVAKDGRMEMIEPCQYAILDRRQRVPDAAMKNAPYKSIGCLVINSKCSCTGGLVGSHHVLTAAHCLVYSVDSTGNVVYTNLEGFLPTENGRPWLPNDVMAFKKRLIPPEFIKLNSAGNSEWIYYDIALLVLEKNVAPKHGFLGFTDWEYWAARGKSGYKVTVAGYPGKVGAEPFEKLVKNEMWDVRCGINSFTYPLIFHECNTTPGDSGAPILMKNDEYGWQLVGVHTAPVDRYKNRGTRMNREWQTWVHQAIDNN